MSAANTTNQYRLLITVSGVDDDFSQTQQPITGNKPQNKPIKLQWLPRAVLVGSFEWSMIGTSRHDLIAIMIVTIMIAVTSWHDVPSD